MAGHEPNNCQCTESSLFKVMKVKKLRCVLIQVDDAVVPRVMEKVIIVDSMRGLSDIV